SSPLSSGSLILDDASLASRLRGTDGMRALPSKPGVSHYPCPLLWPHFEAAVCSFLQDEVFAVRMWDLYSFYGIDPREADFCTIPFNMNGEVAERHTKVLVLREDLTGTFSLLIVQRTKFNQRIDIPPLQSATLSLDP